MSFLKEKSYSYALNSIGVYKDLITKNEYVLSKQFMRSSTSIGANIREAINAQSKKDFIHKLSISQKECDESLYWLRYKASKMGKECTISKLCSSYTTII